MRLMTLDSTWLPVKLVENYSSLIWTERFRVAGDFELKTSLVEDTMTSLPLGIPVCIEESDEVCLVESYLIETDEDGETTLTVTGRSFETFFENRVARPDGTPASSHAMPLYNPNGTSSDWMFDNPYFGTSAITCKYLLGYWGEAQTEDSFFKHPMPLGVTIPNWTVSSIPQGMGNPSLRSRSLMVRPGTVYENVLEFLALDNLGIKNARPIPSAAPPPMYSNIYQGWDRTERIVFSTSAGHFTKTSQLFSIKNWKNAAWSFSYYKMATQYNTQGPSASSLNRRIGFVDASDIKTASPNSIDAGLLNTRGNQYLSTHKKDRIFQGELSPDAPFIYDIDYFMGDFVTVVGDYGFNEVMQVTEHIRIEDETGEKSYPTFDLAADDDLVA